jgi:hypothetical protein
MESDIASLNFYFPTTLLIPGKVNQSQTRSRLLDSSLMLLAAPDTKVGDLAETIPNEVEAYPVVDNSDSAPTPAIEPLKRLHVYDGLMMNTRRWLLADGYHRRRQNLHYQSLHQPGIVAGLGVKVVEAPDALDAKFRDDRWIEIQPGLAIDSDGNPIIVDAYSSTDRRFRIEAKPPSGRSLTVYVVVSYSEPASPTNQQTDETIREWFRFDQITKPPNGQQVELCRIELKDPVQLADPIDVLFPTPNQLDFRDRLQATVRPQAFLRAAQIRPGSNFEESSDFATYTLYQRSVANLAELMESVFSLYPRLQGDSDVKQIDLLTDDLTGYDVLHLPDAQALTEFTQPALEALHHYLQNGGGLFVETSPDRGQDITSIKDSLQPLTVNATTPLVSWEELSRQHPLRRSPFLFGALPSMQSNGIQIFVSGGIVLVEGRLSPAWGLADSASLPRADIRTVQELGVNLLHFFWKRRQFKHLLQWEGVEG